MCLSPFYFVYNTIATCSLVFCTILPFASRYSHSNRGRVISFLSLYFCAVLKPSPAQNLVNIIYIIYIYLNYNFLPTNFRSLTYVAILSEATLSQNWRKRELKIYLAIFQNYLKNSSHRAAKTNRVNFDIATLLCRSWNLSCSDINAICFMDTFGETLLTLFNAKGCSRSWMVVITNTIISLINTTS